MDKKLHFLCNTLLFYRWQELQRIPMEYGHIYIGNIDLDLYFLLLVKAYHCWTTQQG